MKQVDNLLKTRYCGETCSDFQFLSLTKSDFEYLPIAEKRNKYLDILLKGIKIIEKFKIIPCWPSSWTNSCRKPRRIQKYMQFRFFFYRKHIRDESTIEWVRATKRHVKCIGTSDTKRNLKDQIKWLIKLWKWKL